MLPQYWEIEYYIGYVFLLRRGQPVRLLQRRVRRLNPLQSWAVLLTITNACVLVALGIIAYIVGKQIQINRLLQEQITILTRATGLLPMDKTLEQSSPDGERAGKP